MKKVLSFALLFALMSTLAFADEFLVAKSKDITSEDIPLKFECEKAKLDGNYIKVWGTVKNTGTIKYTYVDVIITAKDNDNKFIGRKNIQTKPAHIAPGQVGYITGRMIECEGRRPALLEYSVIGDKD